tara:strand:+ start:817 stop:1137 length:321 start_codon:yes stop_codon:yes gene_type:complete
MDNSLMNAPTYTDPVQKIMDKQQYENSLDDNQSDQGDCELRGDCHLGKKNKQATQNYTNYKQGQLNIQATHQGYTAQTGGSQLASGSAFDTTLDRYSPNVAQVINF